MLATVYLSQFRHMQIIIILNTLSTKIFEIYMQYET